MEDLGGPYRFSDRLGKGFAFLASQKRPELLLAGDNLVADLLQDRVAF